VTLREQLIRDEGMRLRPYRDSVGKLTIGVGRNLDDKGISLGEADLLLDNDLSEYSAAVLARVPSAYKLDEARRAVLVGMAFNMGIAGLMRFKVMLAMVERGDYAEAARAMLDSLWARQVGHRAERLAIQMETGTWQ